MATLSVKSKGDFVNLFSRAQTGQAIEFFSEEECLNSLKLEEFNFSACIGNLNVENSTISGEQGLFTRAGDLFMWYGAGREGRRLGMHNPDDWLLCKEGLLLKYKDHFKLIVIK